MKNHLRSVDITEPNKIFSIGHFAQGMVFFEQKRYQSAIVSFETALYLDPSNQEAQEFLTLANVGLKDPQKIPEKIELKTEESVDSKSIDIPFSISQCRHRIHEIQDIIKDLADHSSKLFETYSFPQKYQGNHFFQAPSETRDSELNVEEVTTVKGLNS